MPRKNPNPPAAQSKDCSTNDTAIERKSRRGIPNRQYESCTVRGSRCPKCKSSCRTKYYRKYVYYQSGERDGEPYNCVVLRYCSCKKCGTPRCERSFELI